MAMIDIQAQDAAFQENFYDLVVIAEQLRDLAESICWQEEEAEIDSARFRRWSNQIKDLQGELVQAGKLCKLLLQSAKEPA